VAHGDVKITQFVEIETLGGKEDILPQATPEALRRLKWLCPHATDQQGRIRITHSFLVETPTRNEPCSRFVGTPTLMLGGHFVGGTIVRDGEAFRLAI